VYLGAGFSLAVAEPGESSLSIFIFWSLFGAILAAPFWLPVFASNKPGVIAGVLRLGSLVGLAVATFVAGHQFYFDINRSIQGQEVSFTELLLDVLVAIVSAISIYIVFKSNSRVAAIDT